MIALPASLRAGCINVAGYAALLRHVLTRLEVLAIPPVTTAFMRQIYFTGIEAWKIVAVLALVSGALIITQLTAIVGGNSALAAQVFGWTLMRELGPLMTAVIIVARSSAAIASELAIMNTRDELAHLRALRIDPADYLAVPRIAGVTLAVMGLTVHFQIIAILGGLGITALTQEVTFVGEVENFLESVSLAELGVTVLKSLVFGLGIATISCHHGLDSGASHTEVPRSAIRAVMHSLVFVVLVDALFAWGTWAL